MSGFDVIIVGSGPAGVSAAFPLLEAGLRVLMVDGGRRQSLAAPAGAFLDLRATDADQWKWMIGEDFYALDRAGAVSPKLRAPTHRHVFEGFEADNSIEASGFIAIGSCAPGGLSNAWGCGVAALSDEEMADYPAAPAQMRASYARVAERIGLSGAADDDLSGYFGVDAWADAPLSLDGLQAQLHKNYGARKKLFSPANFKLGRARVAALSRDRGARLACDRSGLCLWGCRRRALYAATDDLETLRGYPHLTYWPGFVVESVGAAPGASVSGVGPQGAQSVSAKKIILAAGTLASTRLALQALRHFEPVPMQACPIAAFLLWAPLRLGAARESAFGLGQLAFSVDLSGGARGFGSLFNATGIPVAEFSRFLPLRKSIGVDVLSRLMSSCAIGNLFLPGGHTRASLRLTAEGALRVEGDYAETVGPLMKQAEKTLRAAFLPLGALVLPGGFQAGRPGGDIHYAASLPMRAAPGPGASNAEGEVHGLADVHVVDGAALPSLGEKSHTLTVMANADRIGREIAERLRA